MSPSKSIGPITLTAILLFWCTTAMAHFGMIIPSDAMVMQEDPRTISVTLSFSHPMEMIGMDLARPEVFKVVANGAPADLLPRLKPVQVMGHPAWRTDYAVKRPGGCISSTCSPNPTGSRPRTASSCT